MCPHLLCRYDKCLRPQTVYLCAIKVWFHHRIKIRTSRAGAQAPGCLRSSNVWWCFAARIQVPVQSQGLAPTVYLFGHQVPIRSHWWARKAKILFTFLRPTFCTKKKKMFLQPTKKKCVSYLHKTNVRDDLRSKNKCLAHVFVLAKNVIAVPLCAGGWGERDQWDAPSPRGPFRHTGQREL